MGKINRVNTTQTKRKEKHNTATLKNDDFQFINTAISSKQQ